MMTIDEADQQLELHDNGQCGVCNADEVTGNCQIACEVLALWETVDA